MNHKGMDQRKACVAQFKKCVLHVDLMEASNWILEAAIQVGIVFHDSISS